LAPAIAIEIPFDRKLFPRGHFWEFQSPSTWNFTRKMLEFQLPPQWAFSVANLRRMTNTDIQMGGREDTAEGLMSSFPLLKGRLYIIRGQHTKTGLSE
jgi:hypothetical protein